MHTNIRLGGKWLALKMAPAYYTALINTVKRFIIETLETKKTELTMEQIAGAGVYYILAHQY